MMRKVSTHILRAVLAAGIVLGVLGALRPFDGVYPEHSRRAQDRPRSGDVLSLSKGQALAATGNIDPVNKWAWGTNVGWINFRPEHGGVTVYSDHLEGYAWGENVGWIRLGSYTGGGSYTYGNTTKDNYGVNRDGSGNLSGYAWGTSVGWINFSPTHGGVTIDPASGSFGGYAWAENVGWIHFTRPGVYNVVVVEEASDIYLPILLKGYVPPVPPPAAPDLVVDDLVATSTAVTVTISNAGTAAVTDEFWVDVYFDPSETPSLNNPWPTIADHGAVWLVPPPIAAGGVLTLTTGGQYYVARYSSTPPLPVGVPVYALVDSVDYSTTYGAVQESDESNNLGGPVTSTAATGEAAPVFRQSQPASREGLPPR